MENKNATLKLTVSYTDPANEVVVHSQSVTCPYQAQTHGSVDVANATAGGTVIAVPFGAVAAATCAILKNRTGQELLVKVNGNTDEDESLPANGVRVFGSPTAAAETALASISVTTTATQSGAGSVEYHVFGDPT